MRYLISSTCFLIVSIFVSAETPQQTWIATWGASPAPQLRTAAEVKAAHFDFENQTLREIVHTSVSGETIRLKLSNAYGTESRFLLHYRIRDPQLLRIQIMQLLLMEVQRLQFQQTPLF